jgi:mannose-6-phosphate isomerase-like protein (cupin superfamily)
VASPQAISPRHAAAALEDYWSPQVIGELDESYLKVAKVLGTFGWHSHDDEDELFVILAGHLRIEMDEGAVELDQGELFVVPRGTRHNPVAIDECLILLIERKSTLHSGNQVTEWTRSLAEQLGGR